MDAIADKIQRRRLQILIHSYIYYRCDRNVVSDRVWDRWAKELTELQRQNPDTSRQVIWYEAFKDWDGSTGEFLPLDDPWVARKARQVFNVSPRPRRVNKQHVKKALF